MENRNSYFLQKPPLAASELSLYDHISLSDYNCTVPQTAPHQSKTFLFSFFNAGAYKQRMINLREQQDLSIIPFFQSVTDGYWSLQQVTARYRSLHIVTTHYFF